MLDQNIVNIVYLVAAVLFILDLKMLAHPRTAVRGNYLGALGMVLAIVATLASGTWDWTYIILGIALMTPFAIAGAVFYLVHHIVVKANLFQQLPGLLQPAVV